MNAAMTAYTLYKTATRVLGVYFLVTGLAYLSNAAVPFMLKSEQVQLNPFLGSSAALWTCLIYIASGLILLAFYQAPDPRETAPLSVGSATTSGLKVLGLYICISSLSGLLRSVGESFVFSNDATYHWSQIAPNVLYLASGLLLVFRTDWICRKLHIEAHGADSSAH